MTPLHGATEGLVPVGAGCRQCQKDGLLVLESQRHLLMFEHQKDILLVFEHPLVFEQQKDVLLKNRAGNFCERIKGHVPVFQGNRLYDVPLG